MVLAAALGLAVVAYFALPMLNNNQAAPPVHMLVANDDLPAGMLLRATEYNWQTTPADAAPKDAILEESLDAKTLPGALLHNPIAKGQPILNSDIITSSSPGFLAATLKPGMRAVSVAVNEVSGNAGLIQPGDYVDLLLLETSKSAPSQWSAHSMASETIATGMRVIAVGSTFERPKSSDIPSVNVEARTVTLEVTPRAAEVVTLAARMGDLSLSLRSFATDSPNASGPDESTPTVAAKLDLTSSAPANGPIWAGDISQAARTIDQQTNNNSGAVQILRGGSAATANSSTTTPQ
jgi:pilus assembly protein CpaB